jgi:drug/metabolite transporter (DMT)-like permease
MYDKSENINPLSKNHHPLYYSRSAQKNNSAYTSKQNMSIPLLSFLPAIASPASYAVCNITDNYLAGRFKGKLSTLLASERLLQLSIILPFIFYFAAPMISIPLPLLGIMALCATLHFIQIFPYYIALKHSDTSIIVSLFSLGKIFVPILATCFLGEHLKPVQYIGFFMIIGASFALTFNPRKFHINQSLLYMCVSSLLGATIAVLGKYVLMQGIDWELCTLWEYAFGGVIAFIVISAVSPRKFTSTWKDKSTRTKKMFFAGSVFAIAGTGLFLLALSLLPTSIAVAINSTQALFVGLYAKLFDKKLPGLFKENSSNLHPAIKYTGLLTIIAGTILTVI